MQSRNNRNADRHRFHQRHWNAFHIAIRARYRWQQEDIRVVEHRFHFVARFKARHLYHIFQLILFDEGAQASFPRANAEDAIAKCNALLFQLPAGFDRHMQAFFFG